MRVVFFGTPHFAKEILATLLDHHIEVAAVVTRKDKPLGRSQKQVPPPVKTFALEKKLPVYQPDKASDPEFATFLKSLDADFFVIAAFSEILKENLLEVPRFGCINVHASLLPKYRGAAPVQRCIMEGEKESGVTIMKIDAGLDTGGILAVEKTPIHQDMTAGELAEVLVEIGSKKLLDVIQNFDSYPLIEQNDEEASYAKKLKLEDGYISWDRPAQVIYNQIRGCTPKPGAWTEVEVRGEKKRFKIKKARLSSLQGEIGEVVGEPLTIACQTGAIELLEVQLEGKKAMTSEIFMRGINKILF
ncbi:MAG: Methionyl-tRNA formyltransferase [Chlamydiales bacterium]|nr:Methionyl-tRNA formyltransferase [Chlamydiales bacterium]MCH9619767.1 Methionyl-tRNA formyltransferase [Chlamydiales bacterium]MCH9623373.1 Methionyl-tRNA formyltransferase [Chlamydiales bacterium]